ncbi:MAG: hypothetical protein ACLFVP_06190 [Candidatus Bathyarchaeia archaeon]
MKSVEMESEKLKQTSESRESREHGIEILEEFLVYLSNHDRWYNVKELAEKFKLEGYKIRKLRDFFASYDFIEVKSGKELVRIDPDIRKLYISP